MQNILYEAEKNCMYDLKVSECPKSQMVKVWSYEKGNRFAL